MLFKVVPFVLIISLVVVFTTQSQSSENPSEDLDQLYAMMSGTFSSEEQSIEDSAFFHINLVMHPIWKENEEAKWLYVEQAVADYLDRPYRQRVYKITEAEGGIFASKVYELPGPERFVHAWDNMEIFDQISPDSLIVREGCAVYLQKDGEGCFTGSTKEKDCKSTLRGASYATSVVTVCEDGVVSWDQGWNETDEQVWGAIKSGYHFKKK